MCGQEKIKYSEGQRSPFFRFSWATKITPWLYHGEESCVTGGHLTSRKQGLFPSDKRKQRRKRWNNWQRKCTRQSNLSYSQSQFPRSTLGTPVTSKPIFLATKIKRFAFYDWGFPTEARVISSRDSCSENNAELFCKGGLRNVQIFTSSSHTVTVSLVKAFFGDFLIAVAVVIHWGSLYYFLVR